MQDQGKRLLLAVALALGFMLIWQNFFAKKEEPPPNKPVAGSNTGSAAVPSAALPTSQVGIAERSNKPVVSPAPRGPEQLITLSFPKFKATFSSYGGTLKSWHLNDSRYANDLTHGDLLPTVDSGPTSPDVGAFGVNFWDSTYVLPIKSEWTGTKVSDTEIKYTTSTPELDVTKTFTIVPDAFIVRATVSVTVKAGAPGIAHEALALTAFGFQDPKHADSGSSRVAARVWESSTYRDGSLISTPVTSVIEYPRLEHDITWTGFEHPYLLVGFSPKPNPTAGSVDKHTYAQPSGLMETDVVYGAAAFKAGDPAMTREVVGYLGPKNYDVLDGADTVAGFPTGFKAVMDFGWFGFIGRPLLWLLLKFYRVVGNWGIAIVLLTLLVKGLTIPFTTKSMRSMKAMAALGPQMKGLQEKYKTDKQRLQIETMALYKQHGVNPLSGCLPIFLQMPIWLALYRMLSNAGELYMQPFIPGWINDLTAPDPVYVLPVVLMVTMFAQARLTPTNPDPSQKMQQRLMQYGMPLMFGVMSFFFPSGLTLYIFTNTCLSALHSIYMNKFDKRSIEIAAMIKKNQAAAVAGKTVPSAVKNAKDANPKVVETTADEDDDADDATSAAPATKERNPRSLPARQKRNKKGRRR